MRFCLSFCLLLIAFGCFAQERTVEGFVIDKTSKEHIASVNIENSNKGIVTYDNLKGEFHIAAADGDKLIFSRINYHPDTIVVKGDAPIAVYLERLVIQLREVTVRDSALTPEQKLENVKEEFARIYSPSMNPDAFSNSSYGGAGLSIDYLYNAISRSGRNAARLRATIQRDYQENVIDYRFSKTFVARVTGLKEPKLTSFMFRYRPSYYTVVNMTDYEFISLIRGDLRRYLRNQRMYALPPLSR
jgi:hypothetical protein